MKLTWNWVDLMTGQTYLFKTLAIPKSPSWTRPLLVRNIFCKNKHKNGINENNISRNTGNVYSGLISICTFSHPVIWLISFYPCLIDRFNIMEKIQGTHFNAYCKSCCQVFDQTLYGPAHKHRAEIIIFQNVYSTCTHQNMYTVCTEKSNGYIFSHFLSNQIHSPLIVN